MAGSNIDITGGKSSGSIGNGNGNNNNNNGSIVNVYNGNGNAVHDNYGTVHNMFIVLNICQGIGAQADDGDQDHGAAPMVARVLGVIGVATSSIATGATAYKYNRPRRVANHGRDLAYLIAIVVVFLAGLAEVGAAFWVSVDNRNRYGVSRKIMSAAIVLLVLTVGLGCFAIVFKN
ncbi:hypothetical protein QYE76_013208 [Lolium multiflorum]|uniref:Uncharacterized protein n=1 Tax=Lolium multiflorum TaxID=4521 RepID=A0AAD8X4M2_LOLMU|nr:hypothetical protein QYE76_013208 [Lolium multiflorum]